MRAKCPSLSHMRFLQVSCPCPICVLEALEVAYPDGSLGAAAQAWPALLSHVYHEWNWSLLTLYMSIKCPTLSRLSYAGYFSQNFISSHPHEAVKMKHPLQVPFELVDPEDSRSLACEKVHSQPLSCCCRAAGQQMSRCFPGTCSQLFSV